MSSKTDGRDVAQNRRRVPDQWQAATDILLAACWFGLAAGVLEALVFMLVRLVPGMITWSQREMNISPEFLWIAPLVNGILFLALGGACVLMNVVLGIVSRVRAMPPDIFVLVFGWLAAYVVFRTPDRLYQSAVIILSLGLAVRIWTWFRSPDHKGRRVVRRSLPWLFGIVVVVAVTMRAGAALTEARATDALSPAPAGAPNVVLIVVDTLRADHLSAYGYDRRTSPNLDRLADEGVLFDWAIAPSSWTLPSHASLFTGRTVHEHDADSGHPVLDYAYPTVAELMARRGFRTAGFSANVNWATGQAGLARGFLHFEDYFESVGDAVARTVVGKDFVAPSVRRAGQRRPLGRRPASQVTDESLAWIDRVQGRPFFAFLNYFDVHTPYIAPMPYHTQFMTEHQRQTEEDFAFVPPNGAVRAPDEAPLFMAGYDGSIAYVDSEIGRLTRALFDRGLMDKTVLIILSDHGEAFAEHGLYSHGHSLYLDQIHVPLIVRSPGRVPAGRRVSSPVSLVDVPSTILTLAGVPSAQGVGGLSLTRFWDGTIGAEQPDADPILSEVGHRDGVPRAWPISAGWVRSLVTPDWHFIEAQSGSVELFRFRDDPMEVRNLADTAEASSQVSAFRDRLRQMIQSGRSLVR